LWLKPSRLKNLKLLFCISSMFLHSRPKHDWFADLFGFVENDRGIQDHLRVVPDEKGQQGHLLLQSLVSEQSYKIGLFESPTLAELRRRGKALKLFGKLTVTNELGDVSAKQAKPENRHATFQVASQFNCLEFVGPNVTPEHGVTDYIGDRTQGPACSISCGPATVYRNYFLPLTKDGRQAEEEQPDQIGQSAELQLNNLVDFGLVETQTGPLQSYYNVKGGYSMSSTSKLQQMSGALGKLDKACMLDTARAAIRVGIHNDVQVTSSNWTRFKVTDPEQTVTQVFGSACAVSYNYGTDKLCWKEFACIVLEASYEATLWAAVMAAARHCGDEGSRKVFLTCLGGGVFGNSMHWIVEAIRRACSRFKDYNLDVRIVSFALPIPTCLLELEQEFC